MGARRPIQGLAIGAQEPLIIQGPVQAQSWSLGGKLTSRTTRVATALQELYSGDPVLGSALASGLATEAQAEDLGGAAAKGADARAFATTAGRFLAAPEGPSIAVMSLDGFDTTPTKAPRRACSPTGWHCWTAPSTACETVWATSGARRWWWSPPSSDAPHA